MLQPHFGFDTMLSEREVHEATESFCILSLNAAFIASIPRL
jgi:hypothetical protein